MNDIENVKTADYTIEYTVNSFIILPTNFKRTRYFKDSKFRDIIYDLESYDEHDRNLVKFINKFIYSFSILKEKNLFSKELEEYKDSIERYLEVILQMKDKVSDQESELLVRSLSSIPFPALKKDEFIDINLDLDKKSSIS